MSERFYINFGREEYSFNTSKVKFINGYAVLVKYINNKKMKAIINNRFEMIMPFNSSISSIEIFPKENFIVSRRGSNKKNPDGPSFIHYRMTNGELTINTNFENSEFERIDAETIKFINPFPNYIIQYGFEFLYNVVTEEAISSRFTKINDFKETEQGEVAEAFVTKNIDGTNKIILTSLIDKKGNVLMPFWTSLGGKIDRMPSTGLDSYIEKLEKECRSKENEIKNQAVKTRKFKRFLDEENRIQH